MKTAHRSEAQLAASKTNGSLSLGPVTSEGKMSSSMNAVRHGLGAKFVLLPDEDPERYKLQLDGWIEALRPASVVEANLVAGAADLAWRLQRLAELERHHVSRAVEKLVSSLPVGREYRAAEAAHVGIKALAELAAEETAPRSSDDVGNLLPAIMKVLSMVGEVDLPRKVVEPVVKAVEELQVAAIIGSNDEFKKLATAAMDLAKALQERAALLAAQVDEKRQELGEQIALAEEKTVKTLERRRAALQKELDVQLDLIRKVRELSAASGSFEHPLQPVLIEVRAIGRSGRP